MNEELRKAQEEWNEIIVEPYFNDNTSTTLIL